MKTHDRDYDIRADYPDFEVIQEHGFRALAETLDDGRYIVVTNMGGMDLPTYDDFMVCIYRSEDSFGDDPTVGILGCFSSDRHDDLEDALNAAVWLTLGDS